MEKDKAQNNRIIPIFVLVIGVFAIILMKHLFIDSSYNKVLLNKVHEINRSCPVMIDQDTRLDSACIPQHLTLQYDYTMVNVLKDSMDIINFHANLEQSILYSVKQNPELKPYLENNVTIACHYKDRTGNFVTKVSITPEQYRNK
ncbi:MAG: hypothetical protein M0P26_03725 [Bacteroidales bacterium]|nr:hypothetical protein [Bacteroidales bacterium]